MRNIREILCPIDFSECSRHALQEAVAVARHQGAAITALHVVTPVISMIPAEAPFPTAFEAAAETLDRHRREAVAFVRDTCAWPDLEAIAVEGHVVDEIVRSARDLPADLLVMGTHGRSGFSRLMLGSVTERTLRKAPCPVLTVPPRFTTSSRIGRQPFGRVLCALDLSLASRALIDAAALLTQGGGTELTVLHVVEPVPAFEVVTMGGAGGELDERARDTARRRLAAIAGSAPGAAADGEIVTTGTPYREILRVADEHRCDLIVLGVGATADHVIREATCPVLSVGG
jgi:nucleotide-binding universal stress UspA family protein